MVDIFGRDGHAPSFLNAFLVGKRGGSSWEKITHLIQGSF